MAETIGSLLQTPDPKSQIISHSKLQLTTDSYFMERGPRYKAYSQLRESKLRSKRLQFDEDERESKIPRSEFTPPAKKSVRFQESLPLPSSGRKQGCSVLAQSVPDFSSAVRKENRRPPENRIPKAEKSMTPPPAMARREKMYGSGVKEGGGSRSVNSGEKQSNGRFMMMGNGRKSCASIEELKGLSIAACNSINGEIRGGKRGNVLRKSTVLSTRY